MNDNASQRRPNLSNYSPISTRRASVMLNNITFASSYTPDSQYLLPFFRLSIFIEVSNLSISTLSQYDRASWEIFSGLRSETLLE